MVSFSWPREMKTAFKKLQRCPFVRVARRVSSSVHALLWGFVRLWQGCDTEADWYGGRQSHKRVCMYFIFGGSVAL